MIFADWAIYSIRRQIRRRAKWILILFSLLCGRNEE